MIEVILSSALICFAGDCFPALVGADTPRGEFRLRLERRHEPMFRGDVLVFHEDARSLWAIHRAHNDRRRALLATAQRTNVTAGCVNVSDAVYAALAACCAGHALVVQ